ncbi:MAG: ABC transporter substrate-binding protein [Desulfuromonadaceae bacterium GWC2_58_13]|nr:MAG: ABC transporter substrate-binding protein [Desulfuromonadaceae bacterium GWC2_58_13]
MKRLLLLLLPVVAVAVFSAGCDRIKERPVLRIGYMNCNNERETMERFAPLSRYLSEQVGVTFETIPVDTHEFEERFRAGEFALTHTNSLLYILLKEDAGLKLVAADKRGHYGSRTAGTLIARKGSGIETLEDIRGKRLVFGPMMAPTGYLAQYDLMLQAGIDPERDLGYYAIPAGSFKHEKLIYGVYFGDFDVAAAPALDLEEMTREGKIAADDFVILAQSQIVPYCTFGAAPDLDPVIFAKVRQALLELTPTDTVEIDGERVKVLKAAWVDGFEELLDSDYDPIREMARRVNMPPYQTY